MTDILVLEDLIMPNPDLLVFTSVLFSRQISEMAVAVIQQFAEIMLFRERIKWSGFAI